jgi:hypothetical protein
MAPPIAALRKRRVEVRWTVPPFDAGVGAEAEAKGAPVLGARGARGPSVAQVVDDAVRARARATRVRAEKLLRRLGVRVVTRGATAARVDVPAAAEAAETSEAPT